MAHLTGCRSSPEPSGSLRSHSLRHNQRQARYVRTGGYCPVHTQRRGNDIWPGNGIAFDPERRHSCVLGRRRHFPLATHTRASPRVKAVLGADAVDDILDALDRGDEGEFLELVTSGDVWGHMGSRFDQNSRRPGTRATLRRSATQTRRSTRVGWRRDPGCDSPRHVAPRPTAAWVANVIARTS